MATGKSLDTFRREAAKCVLVCANCHGEIEAGLTPSPPPQARFGEDWASLPASSELTVEPAAEERNEPLQIRLDEMEI